MRAVLVHLQNEWIWYGLAATFIAMILTIVTIVRNDEAAYAAKTPGQIVAEQILQTKYVRDPRLSADTCFVICGGGPNVGPTFSPIPCSSIPHELITVADLDTLNQPEN